MLNFYERGAMTLINHRKKTFYEVVALQRALDILNCFDFQNRKMTLSEIVRKTRLNKTTCKRLIANLTERNYLQQDPTSKCYELGIRLFELGGVVFSSFSLRKAAAYHMSQLQRETGATVLLGVKMEHQLVHLDKREGNQMLRVFSEIGWRMPLDFGMLGILLMAYLDPNEVKTILKKHPLRRYTSFSITQIGAFLRRLEKVRKDGYIIEREEAIEGAMGVAAPIRDYTQQVIAALGLSMIARTSTLNKSLGQMVDLVKRACDEISAALGYR
jgi:DNA-binding IclR family transcriptional regulator